MNRDKNHKKSIAVKRRFIKEDLGQLCLRLFGIHVWIAADWRCVFRFEPIVERSWNYRPDLGYCPWSDYRRTCTTQHFQISGVSSAKYRRV